MSCLLMCYNCRTRCLSIVGRSMSAMKISRASWWVSSPALSDLIPPPCLEMTPGTPRCNVSNKNKPYCKSQTCTQKANRAGQIPKEPHWSIKYFLGSDRDRSYRCTDRIKMSRFYDTEKTLHFFCPIIVLYISSLLDTNVIYELYEMITLYIFYSAH